MGTKETFKKTIRKYQDVIRKTKGKAKRMLSRKKSNTKRDRFKHMKRPGSALGHTKHQKLRSNSKKRHLRKNESLFLNKDSERRNAHFCSLAKGIKRHKNSTRDNSNSYIKLNCFDKIISK